MNIIKTGVIVISVILILSGCSESKSSRVSYIKVVEKGMTGEQFWVKAVDPYSREQREFELTIDEMNAWNLIEEDNEYLATYVYTSLDDGAELLSIKHPAKANE